MHSLNKLSSGFIATFLLREPVITAIFAWILFSENLSLLNWFAFFLVLVGIYLAELKWELIDLARKIYLDFSLNTLIRVDIRADTNGVLYVLEANPKPDLKRPTEKVTSLVAVGLVEQGMNYEDLISNA